MPVVHRKSFSYIFPFLLLSNKVDFRIDFSFCSLLALHSHLFNLLERKDKSHMFNWIPMSEDLYEALLISDNDKAESDAPHGNYKISQKIYFSTIQNLSSYFSNQFHLIRNKINMRDLATSKKCFQSITFVIFDGSFDFLKNISFKFNIYSLGNINR